MRVMVWLLAGIGLSPAALATPVRVGFSGVIEELGGYRLTPEEAEALLGGSITARGAVTQLVPEPAAASLVALPTCALYARMRRSR